MSRKKSPQKENYKCNYQIKGLIENNGFRKKFKTKIQKIFFLNNPKYLTKLQ